MHSFRDTVETNRTRIDHQGTSVTYFEINIPDTSLLPATKSEQRPPEGPSYNGPGYLVFQLGRLSHGLAQSDT